MLVEDNLSYPTRKKRKEKNSKNNNNNTVIEKKIESVTILQAKICNKEEGKLQ